jgi:membrane protein
MDAPNDGRIYHPRTLYRLLSDSVKAFLDDGGPSMGAALAFYTLLSMAPLLLLVIMVAGMAIGPDQARIVLLGELGGLLGETGAEGVRSVLAAASTRESSAIGALVGVFVLIFSATTVFAELKTDLDRIWGFKAPPSGGIVKFVRTRAASFGLVVAISFVLLVSLVASSVVAAFGQFLGDGAWSEALMHAVETLISFGVTTLGFAAVYKLLPSAPLAWRDVWLGAGINALLFGAGKLLIGLYLGKSAVASSFGAAGTVVAVIVWVYWCSQIFFLGAEITKVNALRRKQKPWP